MQDQATLTHAACCQSRPSRRAQRIREDASEPWGRWYLIQAGATIQECVSARRAGQFTRKCDSDSSSSLHNLQVASPGETLKFKRLPAISEPRCVLAQGHHLVLWCVISAKIGMRSRVHKTVTTTHKTATTTQTATTTHKTVTTT